MTTTTSKKLATSPNAFSSKMPRRPGEGKQISEAFFKRESPHSNIYSCLCGTKRRRTGTSYQNLLSHIQSAHPEYESMLSSSDDLTQVQLDEYFSTSKSKSLFGWFDFIINGLLPFVFVEKQIIRRHVKHDPPSLSTFMKYLNLLTRHVETKIAAILPNKIALVFDGWSTDSVHYLAVFASFSSSNQNGYDTRLLTISPIGDECNLNADEHIEFLDFVLKLYGKQWADVVCLVGDNVSTNKSLSNKTGIPLIGCCSHRFNLAVKDVLRSEEELIMKIQVIMVKLRGLLLSANLRKLTPLKPMLRNNTRWSSTLSMLSRYVRLREFLPNLNCYEIDELSLSVAENRRVDMLLVQLEPLDEVTKLLQSESTTVSDARALFDAVIQKYPDTTSRLASSAKIVHCPNFESGIVKIQRKNCSALSREEKLSTKSLLVSENADVVSEDASLSFAQRALKRQRLMEEEHGDIYADTRFLLPSSNICERLFSLAGITSSERRKRLNPANLESQLFLHSNRDLWNIADLNQLTT